MHPQKAEHLTDSTHWFRYWMPYTFQPLDDGVYLPLNRDHKPLGVITRETIKYEDYAISHGVKFVGDPATFKDVWFTPDQPLVMYNDNPKSRTDYFKRFEVLMSRIVKVADRKAVETMGRLYR